MYILRVGVRTAPLDSHDTESDVHASVWKVRTYVYLYVGLCCFLVSLLNEVRTINT